MAVKWLPVNWFSAAKRSSVAMTSSPLSKINAKVRWPVGIIGFIPERSFPGGVREISIHQSRGNFFADDGFDRRAADVDFLAVVVGDERHRFGRHFGLKDWAGRPWFVGHFVLGPLE